MFSKLFRGIATGSSRKKTVSRIAFTVLNVLFASTFGATNAAALTPAAFRFANPVGMGGAPESATATITMTSAGSLATIKILTQGIANGDFSSTGGSCTVGMSYFAGQTCTVSLSFQPTHPGVRQGALVLVAGDGSVLASQPLLATGTGAVIAMLPTQVGSVAGNGSFIYRGDGIAATSTSLYLPMGGAVDAAENIYISDSNNQRIRKVDGTTQLISTVVGNGTAGFRGDGGPATAAMLNIPSDVKLDGAGNMYIADSANQVVRMVDATTGIITTIAGVGGQSGYSGDGGLATLANLSDPGSLALDGDHALYISDAGNNVVRKVDLSTGIITTVAGTGVAGYSGDNGPATAGKLNYPWGIALGPDGTLYIADLSNNRVRKVSTTGVITTIAGNGYLGFVGNNGPATMAELNVPASVALDVAGNIFIADSGNSIIREINASTGIISTRAGSQDGYSGQSTVIANSSTFDGPYAVFFDNYGNLFVSDMFHQTVRVVAAANVTLFYQPMREGDLSSPDPVPIENDGNAPLNFSAFQPTSYSAVDVATTTCHVSQPLPIGGTCNLGVISAPTATGNYLTGGMQVLSDAANSPGLIALETDVLAVDPTQTTVSSPNNPGATGSSVALFATVTTSGKYMPTGSVTFFEGTTTLGTWVLNPSGATAINISTLTTGAHNITAVYAGDNQNSTSTSPVYIENIEQPTTATIVSSANPSMAQSSVNFTATIAVPVGSTIPATGTVAFYDGTQPFGAASLNAGGIATLSFSALSAGSHTISAHYAGDALNLPSQSATVSQTVSQVPTRTTLGTSNATVYPGASITLTAIVSRTDGVIPTGVVNFMDGVTLIGAAGLDSTGTSTWISSGLAAGNHLLTAVYAGDTNDLTSTSANLAETVQQIGTSTVLSASANPAIAGAALQLSATVSSSLTGTGKGNGGAFSGTITFQEGSNVLGTAAVSAAGSGTVSVSSLSVGAHNITAVYAGNTNYISSSSTSMSETITSAVTTTALTTSLTPSIAGTPITLSATVTGTGGTPTGAMTFLDGGATVGTAPLNSKGVATLATSTLVIGQHTLTAVYAGDAKNNPSTSPAIAQVVQGATSSVALTSNSNPSSFGATVTFVAAVTTNGATATGTVTFSDGSTVLGVAPLSNGSASLNTSALALGSHSILAAYSGDANTNTSQATINQQVRQSGAVTLTSSANPSIAGTSLTLTAAIGAPQGVAVTGTVTFKDNGISLGSSAVNSGTATISISTLAVGQHSIVATYSGDNSNQPGTSSTLAEVVQTAGTNVTLVSMANPALANAPIMLKSTVVGKGGALTGSVTFQDGATVLGTANVNSGTVSFQVPGLSPGMHSLVAVYNGDSNNLQSTSPALSQNVEQTTTVTLASSQNPSLAMDTVTFTVKVTNGGTTPPSGTVTINSGAIALGKVTLDATGSAIFTTAALPTGQYAISAVYSGDAVDLTSTSTALTQSVQLRPTSEALTASSTSLTGGQQVTLISALHYSGPVAPTGTVTFTNNGTTLGTGTLDSIGVATLTVNFLNSAPTVIASYSGDPVYAASISSATNITVNKPTQMTMQLSPSTLTFQSKQHSTTTLTLTSLNSFTDTLDLGCSGLPFAATCTFSSNQVTLAANKIQAIQVVVDTGSPLTGGAQAKLEQHSASNLAAVCFLPGGALLGFLLWSGRKKMRGGMGSLLALLLLIGFAAGLTGCAGLQINGTPAGTYTFKVTATGTQTGITQAIDVTLTVTQ